MFRDFFGLKDELEAKGETFSANTLALLAYRDLMRAAVGDAGSAACSQELVEAEQLRRLSSAELLSLRELAEEGMAEDYAAYTRQQKMEALPNWNEQPPLVQVYFLIRCLRSHADDPQDRLTLLIDRLKACSRPPEDPRLGSLLGIIQTGAEHLLEGIQGGATIDLRHLRRTFQGSGLLLTHLTSWDRAVCITLNLKGYTCTAGCFVPVTPEG